jgi:heme exporter protein D
MLPWIASSLTLLAMAIICLLTGLEFTAILAPVERENRHGR